MTPQYILRKSLCREPHRANGENWKRSAESEIENMGRSSEYAEPGYSQPSKGVLFANWNHFPRGIDSILERYGFAIEWSDEWTTCEECGRAVRTSADSYGWQPSYALVREYSIVCVDCLKNDAESYLESLENHPTRALNLLDIDPVTYGYVKVEGNLENGLHPGQNDNPHQIYARLHPKYPRLLFRVDGVGQFDIGFSVWAKEEVQS